MSKTDKKVDESKTGELSAADLASIDSELDEVFSDEELWDDIEKAEAAAEAGDEPEKDEGKSPAEPAAAAEPAAKDAATDNKPGEKSPGTPPASEKDDPWADATPEQRAAHEADQAQIKKLEHDGRSTRGRLGSMQRQINQLSAVPAPATPTAADKAAADKDGSGGDDEYVNSDEFKAFETEYPEIAAPVRKLVSGQREEVARLRKRQDDADVKSHSDMVGEQKALLEETHEDWEEAIAADGFGAWLDKEPGHIQDAATRNAKEIVDAAQAGDVVTRWKAFRSAQEDAGKDTGTGTPAADADTGDGTKTTLTGKRQRQLDAASSTRTGGPGAALGIPEDGDPEEIWKAMDREEQREAQRA